MHARFYYTGGARGGHEGTRSETRLQVSRVGSGESNAPNDDSWVDQSWLSNAPRTQATTRTNQSNSYFEQDDEDDAYRDLPDSYINDDEDYVYATQSWSTPPPSYDTVRQPESLWQPYHVEQYPMKSRLSTNSDTRARSD